MAKFVFDICEYNQTDGTRDENADIYTKIWGEGGCGLQKPRVLWF